MPLVDTHTHLDYLARDGHDLDEVIRRAEAAGVAWMINPSVRPDRFQDVLAVADRFETVFAAAAVHPTEVQDADPTGWLASVEAMLDHPKVIALGETGLDYYWDKTHVATQQHFLQTFLDMGRARDLPVILHDRDAHDDIFALVSACPGVRGVMHCFSGDAAFAQAMIDRGFFISFAGNLTFPKATALQEAALAIPLERLLIETDAPFLSPVPYRGQPNEPARVQHVAEKIAQIKGISVETVAEVTTENAMSVFALPR